MKRRAWATLAGAVMTLVVCLPAGAATPGDCATHARHGRRTDANACYQALTLSSDPFIRAEGAWGLELYQDANTEFRAAVAKEPGNAHVRVRWGLLLHERFNDGEASKLFQEALERDPKSAEAHLGLAIVAADSFGAQARTHAEQALALDSKVFAAHELMARVALEDSNPTEAVAEADKAIALAPDALDAFAVRAAVEALADRAPDAWLQRMLAVHPTYGAGYALVASQLVMNRRYEDGIVYYRKAIALDPRLWAARSQMAINLMRLGQEDEPRRELELAYNNGYRDAATVNSLRLLDSYKNFTVIKTPKVTLKLDSKEAALLEPYFEAVATRAIETYSKKYQMTLAGPVQIEVYPNHDDFAVRTYGLPGLGALGVTFDMAIAMDSPSGRTPGSFNWAATLWHEMNHVFVLQATGHRAPRWFGEGLAVHEEGQGNAAWSDRLTPDVVVAIRDHKLLPIASLDRGFVHPEFEGQVQISYFQAGRICDFIQERWGAQALVTMMRAFATVKPTPEVVHEALGVTAEAFDEQFLAWLTSTAGPILTKFDEWRTGLRALSELADSGKADEALRQGEMLRHLYPEYVHDANAYEVVAKVLADRGDTAGAAAVLADYQKYGGSKPATLKRLASLQEAVGHPRDAAATLDALNDIYPVNDEDLHRRLGALWLKEGDFTRAIREYAGVVALKPHDKAGALYDLANAYFAARRLDKAEQTVLGALEAAPGFRPAQQLLLKIEDAVQKGGPDHVRITRRSDRTPNHGYAG